MISTLRSPPRRRRLRVALVATVIGTVAASAPSSTPAATQIGQTFSPSYQCTTDRTWIQTGSPGGGTPLYFAPSDGVITSWSHQASGNPPSSLKFKVARPAGGNNYTIVGENGPQALTANSLHTFPIAIPVHSGDVIGITMTGGEGECATEVDGPISSEFTYLFVNGDPPPGPTPVTFMGPDANFQFDVSASLEPDKDLDGLGDETQDDNVQPRSCAGQEATIVGTGRSDRLRGTNRDDVIAAKGGNDRVTGLGGDDLVCGAAGNDVLRGKGGDDRLRGGRGNDQLWGGRGKDQLRGGPGKDKLRGGPGKDRCRGGGGSDDKRRC
jgi:hypothetical protein